jgi:hypothetical protein
MLKLAQFLVQMFALILPCVNPAYIQIKRKENQSMPRFEPGSLGETKDRVASSLAKNLLFKIEMYVTY